MNIKILDCTLRDGGYINNWKFKNNQITNIINSLETASVDIVECGYLNDKKGLDIDSTLFLSTEHIDAILKNSEELIEKVIMINLGDFNIENLPKKIETQIDGIRLAFHKKNLNKAIEEAKLIIELGYKLYFQPMVTKNYKDIEFLSLINDANQLGVYAFYIVDSFGSMTLNEFQRYMILADNNLKQDILLGYHSHNNMQLAFSNAIGMCNTNLKRDIVIDSSIYGIGRGAGNLNTELIVDYLNEAFDKNYDTLPLLEIIDSFLNSMMQKTPWGFSPAQYLSASFNCHPNYATYLINKNTNHIVGVKKVLENIPLDKKSSFDEVLIEKLYIDSLLETKTAIKGSLKLEKKNILLIASGKSIEEYRELINHKIEEKYILIALNHIPDFKCDYYFFSNQKRYDKFSSKIEIAKIIITSNILSSIPINIVLNAKQLFFIENNFMTNVATVAINYFISKGIKKVEIAGLDGYKVDESNYNYAETNIITDNNELIKQNKSLSKALVLLKKSINILFITPSLFEKEI